MTRIGRRWSSDLAALPMGLLLVLAGVPLLFLLAHLAAGGIRIEWSSFAQTMGFAIGGAMVSTAAGGTIGILAGIREFPGRTWLLALAVVPVAAPPAFWWIGATRLTAAWGNLNGLMRLPSLAAWPCRR